MPSYPPPLGGYEFPKIRPSSPVYLPTSRRSMRWTRVGDARTATSWGRLISTDHELRTQTSQLPPDPHRLVQASPIQRPSDSRRRRPPMDKETFLPHFHIHRTPPLMTNPQLETATKAPTVTVMTTATTPTKNSNRRRRRRHRSFSSRSLEYDSYVQQHQPPPPLPQLRYHQHPSSHTPFPFPFACSRAVSVSLKEGS